MKYPFHNEIRMKCPKCGGSVVFNIKKKPEFRTAEKRTGHCEYCDEWFLFDKCEGFPPVSGSGASSSGK